MRALGFLAGLLLSGAASAQTVTPSSFGMNVESPATTTLKIYSSVTRMGFGPGVAPWSAIETSNGVFVWTTLDAAVNQAVSRGQDIIYTFGSVPGWANGNAGIAVPPTSFTDFYTFVTALVTRYKGQIKYYDTWNEVNISTQWAGTLAQMETIASVIGGPSGTIKTADPNALVLSPSFTSNFNLNGDDGVTAFASYAGSGALAFADIINYHNYPAWSLFFYTPPEQSWLMQQHYASELAQISNVSPIIVDEGGYTTPSLVPGVTQQAAWAALWPILLSTSGVSRSLWFAYDDQFGWGPLTDGANWLDQSGVAQRNAEGWLTGATITSAPARVAGTNGIRNPTFTGASPVVPGACPAGTNTGTPPTNMSVSNTDSAHGISTQIAGTGTENGIPYIDLRVCGTATAGARGFAQIALEGGQQIAATLNQQWSIGAQVKLQAGATAAGSGGGGCSPQLVTNENDSGGNFLTTDTSYNFYPITAPLNTAIQVFQAPTVNASIAFIQPIISVGYVIGTPCDITLRIGAPFTDNSSIWSGTLTRPGGYQGQIVWDSSGGPSNFSPSGTYTFRRDPTGNSMPIAGNVTLTNLPILLENQQWKGWSP